MSDAAPKRCCACSMRCRRTSSARATGRAASRRSRPREVERMITLDSLRDSLPDYARDLKLNLGSVLAPAGAPGLSETQIWAIALSAAIASRNAAFARDLERLA